MWSSFHLLWYSFSGIWTIIACTNLAVYSRYLGSRRVMRPSCVSNFPSSHWLLISRPGLSLSQPRRRSWKIYVFCPSTRNIWCFYWFSCLSDQYRWGQILCGQLNFCASWWICVQAISPDFATSSIFHGVHNLWNRNCTWSTRRSLIAIATSCPWVLVGTFSGRMSADVATLSSFSPWILCCGRT